jgi:tetratricopeptide (TPR) repeat protein
MIMIVSNPVSDQITLISSKEACMSEDSFTEITSQSWFQRIGGSIKGIVVGLVLLAAAVVLLFWNEGRAVKRYKTLKEGGGSVISISTNRVLANNEGKLVHASGFAATNEYVTDPDFGISAQALKLKRQVSMYQWEERKSSKEKKKLGGGTETVTTYSYEKVWADTPINSDNFKKRAGHLNPSAMPYRTQSFQAGKVMLGKFKLSRSLVDKINAYEPLAVNKVTNEFPPDLLRNCKIDNGSYYIGNHPEMPEIGDLKISFSRVKPTDISIVARQTVDTFDPYRAKAGGTIELLQLGTHSAQEMFQTAQEQNKMLTWILRLVGFFLMIFGVSMIFKPLSVLADVIPFIGNIVEMGTGFLAFLLGAMLSLITMAVAWIVFRPLLGIALLAGAGILLFGGIYLIKKKKNEIAAPTAREMPAPPPKSQGMAPPPSPPPSPSQNGQPAGDKMTEEGWAKKGQELYQEGNLQGAVNAFASAIYLNPDYSIAYFNRGIIHSKMGNQKLAVIDLKTAAQLGHTKAQNLLKSKGIDWK